MAKHQTQGKGQRGSTWRVEPETALTCSLLLYPADLHLGQAFNLNMAVCLALHTWLSRFINHVSIKWPNDIYVRDQKICGILIENQIANLQVKSSIVGIGLNINQTQFPDPLKQRATSLVIEDPIHQIRDIEACCLSLLKTIDKALQTHLLVGDETLLQQYNAKLYRRNMLTKFEIHGEPWEGFIQEVDAEGKLVVDIEGESSTFDLKEIRYLI